MSSFHRPYETQSGKLPLVMKDLHSQGDEIVYHGIAGLTDYEAQDIRSAAWSYGHRHNIYVHTKRIDENTIAVIHGGVRPIEKPEDRKKRIAEKMARFPGWASKIRRSKKEFKELDDPFWAGE